MNTPNQSNPQTELNKILEIIGKIAKISTDGDYIFRGESLCHEKVSSNLYRKLEETGLLELGVKTVEKEELRYAKKYGYTPKADEFETLTEIQHFGGKTNLLDFTTDYCIALFFACSSFPFRDGRVILQNRSGKIKDWIMEPCNPDPKSRVRRQKSIFVRPPKGFIKPHGDDIITIPANLKQLMLEYLRNRHGMSAETIYPDLHGFVSSQDTRWNIYEDISKGNDHLESGQKADIREKKIKNYQKAVEHFTNAIDNAIQLDEGLAVAYDGRGSVYFSIGELDSSNNKLENAIEDFTEAIKYKSDYASAYNNRGRAYFNRGELENASADFSKAIELMPKFAEAYHYRGLACFLKGNYDDAIADLNEAIRLSPDDVVAYHRRGIIYLRKGDFASATIDLNKAIRMNPNDGLVYYSRGETWLHLREWDKAKVDLAAATQKGVDITAVFHNSYRDVGTFERRNGFKLPKNIVSMLRQHSVNIFNTTQRVLTPEGNYQESPAVLELLEKFRNAGKPLSEYLQGQPSRGITTGCNEAFIVERATRDVLIAEHPSSADVLKPFLMVRDIERWQVKSQDKWLIFAHRGIEIDAYPAIRKHLEKYSDVLKKRSGRQKWYELSVAPANTDRFAQSKCFYPDMASETAFTFDNEGYYIGSPAYLLPTDKLWILGVLNTKAVSWFYARTTPQIRGPFLKFTPRYVSQIPIPDVEPGQKALIHKIVEYILYLKNRLTTDGKDLANSSDYVMVAYFGNIVDGLVYELYLPDELHQGDKYFFQPLFNEQLPQLADIGEGNSDKMPAFRDIFERLYNKDHPVAKSLFFLDSVQSIRVIESKA